MSSRITKVTSVTYENDYAKAIVNDDGSAKLIKFILKIHGPVTAYELGAIRMIIDEVLRKKEDTITAPPGILLDAM